ncbi:MAG: hypothetical protein AAGA75_14330 [Cyanobacteria bacterium P01_E01_bin.6]
MFFLSRRCIFSLPIAFHECWAIERYASRAIALAMTGDGAIAHGQLLPLRSG